LMLTISTLAAFGSARDAARTDPVSALRVE
jgi:ABC-type lipoprotein release transport system permease subunit